MWNFTQLSIRRVAAFQECECSVKRISVALENPKRCLSGPSVCTLPATKPSRSYSARARDCYQLHRDARRDSFAWSASGLDRLQQCAAKPHTARILCDEDAIHQQGFAFQIAFQQ